MHRNIYMYIHTNMRRNIRTYTFINILLPLIDIVMLTWFSMTIYVQSQVCNLPKNEKVHI